MDKKDIIRTDLQALQQDFTRIIQKFNHLTTALSFLKEEIEKTAMDANNIMKQVNIFINDLEKKKEEKSNDE